MMKSKFLLRYLSRCCEVLQSSPTIFQNDWLYQNLQFFPPAGLQFFRFVRLLYFFFNLKVFIMSNLSKRSKKH